MRATLAGSLLAMVISGCAGHGGVDATSGSSTPSSGAVSGQSAVRLSPPSVATSSASVTGSTTAVPCLTRDASVRFDFTQFQQTVCAAPGVVVTVSLASVRGKGWSVRQPPDGAVVALGTLSVGPDGTATITARALRPGSTTVTLRAGPDSPDGPLLLATLTITVPAR